MQNNWRPDWRDILNYPDPNKTTLKEWSWEFLRRNPCYQADFQSYTEDKYKYAIDRFNKDSILKDGDGNLLVKYDISKHDKKSFSIIHLSTFIANKYGLNLLANPAKHYTDIILSFQDASNPMCQYIDDDTVKYIAGMKPEMPGDIIVKFSLSRNLDEQLRYVSAYLKSQQKLYVNLGKLSSADIKSPRNISAIYPSYLRILDAFEEGSQLAEISSIIYPEKSNEYPDYHANKTIINSYNAAIKLRDHDYKKIINAADDIMYNHFKSHMYVEKL